MILDVSADNTHPIDYAAVKAAGVTGVIIKATQGTSYINPHYGPDTAGFTAVGIPTVAYHYAEFTNPVAEARYFQSVAGSKARVLDVETTASPEWEAQFLSALGLASNQEMVYGSASTLPQGQRGLTWPASYGKAPGFGDCWQFTDTGTVAGISGPVDLSEWIGPQADFDSLFSLATPPPVVPSAWLVKAVGGKFGNLNAPIVAIVPTPNGQGYTLVASDGGTFAYGGAPFLGSLAGAHLNSPIVDAAGTADGRGLLMVGTDGGVFAFGTAAFYGSMGGHPLNAPIVAVALTSAGYWMTAADGGIFAFGNAPFAGSPA